MIITLFLPWLLLPLMLNIRIFPFVAPYEEPRWLLFVSALFILLSVSAYQLWRGLWQWHWRNKHLTTYILVVFLLGLLIGILYTPNKVEGLLRFTFWLSACAIFFASIWNARHNKKHPLVLIWATSLSCFTFALHYWWQYITEYGSNKNEYSSIADGGDIMVFFSPIGHVNFTGDVLIILLPMLTWLLWTYRKPALLLMNSISIISMLLILLIGSSRGALGGLFVGIMLTVLISIRHWQPYIKILLHWKTLIAVTGLLIILFITFQFLPIKFRNPARVLDSVNQVFTTPATPLRTDILQPPLANFWWQIQPLIAKERTAIYASSTAMIVDAPLLGHGTGSFSFIFPAYSNHFPQFRDSLSTMRNMASNPHNILFQIASQNGIPMALLFIGLLLYLWWRIVWQLWQHADARLVAASIAMTAALFDSLFNHVFFNPASLFVFVLFAGIWWVWTDKECNKDTADVITKSTSPRRLLAISVFVIGLLLLIWPMRWSLSQWEIGHTLLNNNTPQTISRYYRMAYMLNPYNFRAVAGLAEQEYMQKEYTSSLQLLEWLVHIYPYDAAILNNLASLHIVAGNKD
ncbi:MAG: O-antigen ligase family protein, partial [Mariprofundales bacterium]